MGIYYNPNMASVFYSHVDDAITQLKSAGSTMNSLLKKEFPSKTIIGRRFNNNKSDLENINTTIRDTYKKYLPNIRGDVVAQVLRYEAATQDVYRYMTNMGTYEYKIVKKKKWEDMTEVEKARERYWMELRAGFAGRAETAWDSILVHVGEDADKAADFFDLIGISKGESFFNSIGAYCAKSIETDYWGTWRQDQIEMREMGDDFAKTGKLFNALGGTAFDYTALTTMALLGIDPEAGGLIYSYLTEAGESAQDMYRSKKINVNDRNDRRKVNLGAKVIGAINGTLDYLAEKNIGKMPAGDEIEAFFKTGAISAVYGTVKTINKVMIERVVTGDEEFYIDPLSIVKDAALTYFISGLGGAAQQRKQDILEGKSRNKSRGDDYKSDFDDELVASVEDYDNHTQELRDKANKAKDSDTQKAYGEAVEAREDAARAAESHRQNPRRGSRRAARRKAVKALEAEEIAKRVENMSIVGDVIDWIGKYKDNLK